MMFNQLYGGDYIMTFCSSEEQRQSVGYFRDNQEIRLVIL